MLLFNEHGLLMPAEGIPVKIDEVYETFVQPFYLSETRERLFHEWMKYNQMLQQEIGEGFMQWINGSFVTQKLNPKDIDVVSFIPSYLFRKFEKRLDYYWTDNWEQEGIDAYLVEEYDASHFRFHEYESYLENWKKLYTRTKAGNKPSGILKGFLIVTIA